MSSISRNFGIAFFSRAAVNTLGLIILAILTRQLGPEGFGQYSTIYAYLFFVSIAADMGIGTLLTREISREGADEARITGLLVTLRLVLIGVTTAVAVALLPLVGYGSVVTMGILIVILATAAQSITQVLMGVFQKHLRLGVVAVGDFITRGIQLGGLLVLLKYGMVALIPVLWINVVAEVIHMVITVVAARHIIPFHLKIDVVYWKGMLRSAFPIAASLVFTLVYFKIDTVMLSVMSSEAEVGMYSVAYKVLEVVIFFPAMYVGLIMPLLSKFAFRSSEFRPVFFRAARRLGAGATLTVVALVVFANPIIALIGDAAFSAAVPLLRILSISIGIIFFGNLFGSAIIALDLQRKGIWIYGCGAAINVLLNLLFIPQYGATAAAWNTVATELLVTLLMARLIWPAIKDRAARL
ncbi:MAG: flippase [Patescibacteria group bacterium]